MFFSEIVCVAARHVLSRVARLPERPIVQRLGLLLALALTAGCLPSCDANVSGDLAALTSGDLSNPAAVRSDGYADIAIACGDNAGSLEADASPEGYGRMVRRPYLQRVTDTTAELLWTAADSAAATAVVRDPSGEIVAEVLGVPDPGVAARGGVQQYIAAIGPLAPKTVYCYELRAAEGMLFRAGFRTAPRAGDADAAVRFIAFGDSGNGSSDQRAALAQMRTVPFDLALHTGDLAYSRGSRSEIEAYVFGIYADVFKSFPFFPASGNHEYETEDAAPFREAFSLPPNGGPEGTERWYSFDWGNVHFVALDTERTGPVQASWLEADLQNNHLPWTVVYAHKPPYSSGGHGNNGAFRQYFGPVLERHRVPLVLTGHDHHYERSVPIGGVTYVVTGGGGRGTRSVGKSSFTAFSEAVIHFVYVEVEGNTMVLHAIDGLGQEFDSWKMARASNAASPELLNAAGD